ncbi:MAG: hypothetical protein GX361_02305 [Bacteroidales bacterium]|nr:hypothetical protein [Bacteroidales bacterium]
MKTKTFLFTLFALFLLIGGMGCERENLIDYIDVNVVYQRCNSSVNHPIDGEIKKRDILLFNLAHTKESEIIKRYSQNEEIEYIIYDPNSISANYLIYKRLRINNQGHEYGNFCNFPIADIEKWNIPQSGLYISFSGDFVNTKFTTDAMYSTFDISLKSLKIQQL